MSMWEVLCDWLDDILTRLLHRPPRCGYRRAAGFNCRRRGRVRTWLESGHTGVWAAMHQPSVHCPEHAKHHATVMRGDATFGPWRVRRTEVWPWK